MKSMTRRPSEARPTGWRKKVWPLGGAAWPNTADKPPVSEFESPKLKMAGKLQGCAVDSLGHSSNVIDNNIIKPITACLKLLGSMN